MNEATISVDPEKVGLIQRIIQTKVAVVTVRCFLGNADDSAASFHCALITDCVSLDRVLVMGNGVVTEVSTRCMTSNMVSLTFE